MWENLKLDQRAEWSRRLRNKISFLSRYCAVEISLWMWSRYTYSIISIMFWQLFFFSQDRMYLLAKFFHYSITITAYAYIYIYVWSTQTRKFGVRTKLRKRVPTSIYAKKIPSNFRKLMACESSQKREIDWIHHSLRVQQDKVFFFISIELRTGTTTRIRVDRLQRTRL